MIGASGATFRVMKVGSNEAIVRRLRAQYEWLWRRKYPATVRVGGWYVDGDGEGYSMELLEPLPPSTPEARAVVVMDALEPIWDEAPLSRPGWRPDQAPGFAELEGWTDLAAWFRELTIVSAFYAGTHGDATLENVMRRPATGEVVLIDPVPDIVIDRKVPAVRALDLGKILQSGLGYEAVRSGQRAQWRLDEEVFNVVASRTTTVEEWRLACWCCALHVAKFLPYQTPDHRARWLTWWPDIVRTLREESRSR